MDILNNIQIGDQSIDDKGQVEIMDEDRLCFIVKSESRGTYGLRTISKQLLREDVAYFKLCQSGKGRFVWKDRFGQI